MNEEIMDGRLETYAWGSMMWLADAQSSDGLKTSTARMTVLPNHTSPKHVHMSCDEVVSVWIGQVCIITDDKKIGPLSVNQSYKIPPGTAHAIQNIGDHAAELVITYSRGQRDYIAL